MRLKIPGEEVFESVNDLDIESFPRIARAERHRDPPEIESVNETTREAVSDIFAFETLEQGAEIAITAGSRGITDMPTLIESAVKTLQDLGFNPFVMPAMGSHGGATARGQREVLEDYDITEERLGCDIRASMEVETVGTDTGGRPVPVSTVAQEADAVLLANRVKLHTDFRHEVESGLMKMAVVGLGKQRGAEEMHNAAIQRGLSDVIPERASIIFEHTPVVGGIALVENANERAAIIEGVDVENIADREPELLEESRQLFPQLPVEELDLLIVDEIGKDISGTSMDTNVIGRYNFLDETEPQIPDITRIYARTMTPASHGNGLGMGLADFVHRDLVADLDLEDTYLNTATSGEPSRSFIPIIVPTDRAALRLTLSMTGVRQPADLRIAYIENTLEPDTLYVSEPLVDELKNREDVTVDSLEPIQFDANGNITASFDD